MMSTPSPTPSENPVRNPVFEAKIKRARWAVVAEQLWLRAWVLFVISAIFLVLSLAGIWTYLDPVAHKAVLALFAGALLGWLVYLFRVRFPSREDAIRRIEAVSEIPHRPATSYEDTLTASAADPTTQAIWSAHRQRMAALIQKLRPGRPEPRTYRFDPFALRALSVLAVVLGVALAGHSTWDSLAGAFRFEDRASGVDERLDAWLTPPAYTGRPPLMLVDGSAPRTGAAQVAASEDATKAIEVPEKSVLIVRSSGSGNQKLALEVWPSGATAPLPPVEPKVDAKPAAGVTEVRTEITSSGTIKAMNGGEVVASWPITMIPDNAPGITLTKNPERTAKGAMKLTYFVQDDYGVAAAEVKFTRVKDKGDSKSSTAWARGETLTGPRPPYSKPPRLSLRLPTANAKSGEAFTYHEIGSHPWAGQKVMMTLEAKDVAGQIGRSPAMEVVLPERTFTKPLARALIEQRKLLIEDPRYSDQVLKALMALTLEPEGFIDDPRVYLPLRATVHRLGGRKITREVLDETIDQLWSTALRIEDGNLSEAEKNLRDIQDKLAKALEEGASDEEIRQLMQQLRQAFQEYAQEMMKQNGEQNQQQSGNNQDQQQLSAEDLDRMLREMEQMAENGLRDQAKDMLAQMRDLMERMQQGQQNAEQQRQNKEMAEQLKKLGEAVGEQQSIMDDTFEEGKQQQQGQGGQQMRQTQPGQKGQRGQGMQADRSGQPSGMGDDQGEMGLRERGTDEGQGQARGQQTREQLAQRQAQLRDKIEKMRRDMQEKGVGNDEKLGAASEAMERAEDALREGDLDEASDQQAQALQEMREGAEQMAEQMQRNGNQQAGENGENSRDPMGRPQRSQGPDQGRSVKVPDQIDIQRAREVLEELRKRAGDAQRPQLELDYIDRLLRWY
jgi:uncharacterized protein (TIGR02302 family)